MTECENCSCSDVVLYTMPCCNAQVCWEFCLTEPSRINCPVCGEMVLIVFTDEAANSRVELLIPLFNVDKKPATFVKTGELSADQLFKSICGSCGSDPDVDCVCKGQNG